MDKRREKRDPKETLKKNDYFLHSCLKLTPIYCKQKIMFETGDDKMFKHYL